MRQTANQSGFSLLEVMVAMAILAISLVSLMNLFSQGTRMTIMAEDYSIATLLAKSKMDEVLMANELEEGGFGGTFEEFEGRFSFDISIEEYEIDYLEEEEGLDFDATRVDVPGREEEDFMIFKVVVTIIWGDEGQKNTSLTTLRTDYVLPESNS